MSFNVNIVSTGSVGNCIVIDDYIVIDFGLPYSPKDKTKVGCSDALSKAEVIFVTHRHGDHLNPAVVKRLHRERPNRLANQLYVNSDVLEKLYTDDDLNPNVSTPKAKTNSLELPTDHILTENSNFDITIPSTGRTYNVQAFKLVHDVENQGFVFTNEEGETLVFATDTNTMEFAPRRLFDYIVVEGNYDEDKVFDDMISDNYESRRRAVRNLRHLSIQQFEDFVMKNSHANTIVYQLHESGEYGVRSDLNSEVK